MSRKLASRFSLTAKPQVRVRRIRWMQGGQEITVLPCMAGGTPKTYRDLTAQLVENVNGTDTVMTAVVTDSWEMDGYIKNTGQWTTVNDDIFEDGVATVVLDWDDDQDLQRDLESYNRLRVTMTVGGTAYSSVLPFIFDGATGARGYSGPVLVPKGEWKDNASYTATPTRTEYVFDKVEHDFFHVTPPTSGTRTATVGTRPGMNPSHWTRLGAIDPFYTKMAVINGGTVGKAVYWEEFMYSQYGRRRVLDVNTGYITGYEDVDATHGTYGAPVQTGNPTDTFEPNLLLNFLTGDAFLRNAYLENGFFTGFRRCVPTVITADNIGRMTLRSRFLKVSGQNAIMHMGTENDPNITAFDLKRVGSSIVIDSGHPLYVSEPPYLACLHLPFIYFIVNDGDFLSLLTNVMNDGGVTARREMMRARSYLDCTIEVINLSADSLPVFGLCSEIDGRLNDKPWREFDLGPGELMRATCKRVRDYTQFETESSNCMASNERIYWNLDIILRSYDSNYFDAGLLNSLDE